MDFIYVVKQCGDVCVSCLYCSYGVILEKLQKKDSDLIERIKGCIVDSAPVAAPDPQVIFLA